MESVEGGCSEVAEAFCRAETCKSSVVDGARVSGRFGRSVTSADNGWDLSEEALSEVRGEVVGDVFSRNGRCPRGLSAGE